MYIGVVNQGLGIVVKIGVQFLRDTLWGGHLWCGEQRRSKKIFKNHTQQSNDNVRCILKGFVKTSSVHILLRNLNTNLRYKP